MCDKAVLDLVHAALGLILALTAVLTARTHKHVRSVKRDG